MMIVLASPGEWAIIVRVIDFLLQFLIERVHAARELWLKLDKVLATNDNCSLFGEVNKDKTTLHV